MATRVSCLHCDLPCGGKYRIARHHFPLGFLFLRTINLIGSLLLICREERDIALNELQALHAGRGPSTRPPRRRRRTPTPPHGDVVGLRKESRGGGGGLKESVRVEGDSLEPRERERVIRFNP